MSAISYADSIRLRTAPPVVEYYLAIMPRDNVFACSLNKGAATWGETALTYDAVTYGAWGDVIAGQTLLAYSSTGTYKGKVRVRAIDGGTITIAANHDIEWADDDLLYIVNVFEPWSRPTNMVDAGPGLGITYYKDTDILWSSNAAAFPPKANAGVAFAGFLGSGGYADVPFGGSGWSYANADGASISTHAWDIADGSFQVGGAATETITARFTNAGFRWIHYTVTDDNGQTGVHRLPVWTFGGPYQPLADFSITRRVSDGRDWELQIEAFGDDLDPADIAEGTCVALFVREYIDGTEVTTDMNCPFSGRQHIRMVGWILKHSVEWDPETGVVRFTVGTIGKVADDLPGYPTFIEDKPAGQADGWHSGEGLYVRSVANWLWHWHTNLDTLAWISVQPTVLIAGRKFQKAPPLKQIENDLFMRCFTKLGVTRWGAIVCRYDPQIMDVAGRAARATVIDLTDDDWTTEIAFPKSHRPRLSFISGGGIAYDGSEGTPFRGQAPGRIGRESGKHLRASHLIILSQSDLNDKLGRLLASRSDQQEEITIENYYDVWEPALQEYLSITVAAADNPRGLTFDTDDLWIIRRVEVEDVMGDTPTVRTTCELLVPEGTATGVAVPIPDPPTYPPPPPPPDLPPLEPPEPEEVGETVLVGGEGGIAYTLNAVSGNPPTWTALNTGLSDSSFIYALCNNPVAPEQAACIDDSNAIFVNTDWTAGNNWSSALSEASAKSLIDTEFSITSDFVVLVDLLAVDTGLGTTYLLCTARYQLDLEVKVCVLRSTDWGSSWTCGGAIDGADEFGETDAWRYKEYSGTIDYGVGQLVHDGTYLYICASTPYHTTGYSALNRSSDWGETWDDPNTVTDGRGSLLNPGPACAKTDSNGTLYLVPWKDIDDSGNNVFGSRRTTRSVRCSGASVNQLDYDYIQVGASGDYTIAFESMAWAMGCQDNPGDCPADQAVTISITIETSATSDFASTTQFYTASNKAVPFSDEYTDAIAANRYIRANINHSVGSCEGMSTISVEIVGPSGAETLFSGPTIVASADAPTGPVDINEVKDITDEVGYGVNRGMLELTEDDSWAALQIENPGSTTSQTKLEVNGVLQYTFLHPYRRLYGYPADGDTLYLGRSWLDDEKADVDDPQLFGLSLTTGATWADQSGNLYALGMRSITGIAADWSVD